MSELDQVDIQCGRTLFTLSKEDPCYCCAIVCKRPQGTYFQGCRYTLNKDYFPEEFRQLLRKDTRSSDLIEGNTMGDLLQCDRSVTRSNNRDDAPNSVLYTEDGYSRRISDPSTPINGSLPASAQRNERIRDGHANIRGSMNQQRSRNSELELEQTHQEGSLVPASRVVDELDLVVESPGSRSREEERASIRRVRKIAREWDQDFKEEEDETEEIKLVPSNALSAVHSPMQRSIMNIQELGSPSGRRVNGARFNGLGVQQQSFT